MKLFKTGDRVIVRGIEGILGPIDPASTHVDVMFEFPPQGCYSTITVAKTEVELVTGKQNSLHDNSIVKISNAMRDAEKMLDNSSYGFYGQSIVKCNHQFTRYVGLRETFLFCKLCDLKKEN